jgi:hypothetical protein
MPVPQPVWRHIRILFGHGPFFGFLAEIKNHQPLFTDDLGEALRLDESAATFWFQTLRASDFRDVTIVDADGKPIG